MSRRTRAVLVGVIAIVIVLLVMIGGRDRARGGDRRVLGAALPEGEQAGEARTGAARAVVAIAPRRPAVVVRDDERVGTVRIEGLVLDEDDRPVAGAEVEVSSAPARRVRTELDGAFAIDGLWPRGYVLRAWAGDRYAEPIGFVARATTEPIVVRLRRGNVVTVTVIDATTEQPIVGAMVDDQRAVARTDAAGRVTLRGQYATMVILRIAHADYAPVMEGWSLSDDPDGVAERTVRLVRGAAVSGTVRDPDGGVVAGARVRLAGERAQLEGETDAAGRFAFAHVEPGRYAATAEQVGYSPGVVEMECPGSGHGEVALVLVREARLDGMVVDGAGDGVAGARVVVDEREVTERAVLTGSDGAFTIAGLSHARHVVTASHGGAAATPMEIDLTRGAAPAARLVLAPGTIRGVVVDAAGAPVAEARVRALPTAPGLMLSSGDDVADARGRFEIEGLAPGRYRLRAEWSEVGATAPGVEVEAETGGPDVRLVLAATGAITGNVTRDGRPVSYYAVAIAPTAAGVGATVIRAADGRFARGRLSPGEYTVTVVGPEFARQARRGVVVQANAVTDLGEIAVDAGREVRGRVIDARGTPVGGAEVLIAPSLREEERAFAGYLAWPALREVGQFMTRSDADGGFVVRGVDAAPLNIVAAHPRHGVSAVVAISDEPVPIILALGATGAISEE